MKQKIKLLTIGLILTLCAGFASCGGGSSSSSSSSPEPIQLTAPSNLDFYSDDRGKTWKLGYILSWDEVEGADGYEIELNGETIPAPKNKFNLVDYVTAGNEYEVFVKAKGDGIEYEDSQPARYEFSVLPVTLGLSYKYNERAGTCSVSYGNCSQKDIAFPNRSNGFLVTEIEEEAFWPSDIESVLITKTIVEIKSHAFTGCKNLKSVSFEKGSSLKTIGTKAFMNCNLEEITLPASLESVGLAPFEVKAINVDEENLQFTSIDGNLYTKDGKKLIQYASKKTEEEFVFPSSTTDVEDYAFYKCEHLKKVTMPEGLEVITRGSYFWGCPSLTTVILSEGIKEYKDFASNCPNFIFFEIPEGVETIFSMSLNYSFVVIPKTVKLIKSTLNATTTCYYKGTQEEWLKIEFSKPSLYENAVVYFYSEDEPEEEGNFWHYNSEGEIEIWE